MAEPNNTPYPPSTPVPASTPRSASPAPPIPNASPTASTVPHVSGAESTTPARPIVLHIGDPIKYNPETYAEFSTLFDVVRPSAEERERREFMRALKERRWGDFSAIFRPFWGTGGEMGRWDAELIDLLPGSVRVFASAGAGFDWADTQLLGEKSTPPPPPSPTPSNRNPQGIIYCNSGLAAAEAVADFAVAMVISTFRHLPWCISAAVSPDPSAFSTCHAQATGASHTLRGHILGLVGFGNIGQQIAAKLGHSAFGMRIAYHDVVRRPAALEAALSASFHSTLPSLLAASDCVVLCTPASPDGRPLITPETLRHLKPGARFVNVARGSLVDEDALADALEGGLVSAAALDVHATEPRVHPRLLRLAGLEGETPGRVMLTCHNAGGTVETHVGFEELSMRNIMAVLRGGEAMTPVNLEFLRRG